MLASVLCATLLSGCKSDTARHVYSRNIDETFQATCAVTRGLVGLQNFRADPLSHTITTAWFSHTEQSKSGMIDIGDDGAAVPRDDRYQGPRRRSTSSSSPYDPDVIRTYRWRATITCKACKSGTAVDLNMESYETYGSGEVAGSLMIDEGSFWARLQEMVEEPVKNPKM